MDEEHGNCIDEPDADVSAALRRNLLTYMWARPTDPSVGAERAEYIDYQMAVLRREYDIDLGQTLRSDSNWEHNHQVPRELSELIRREVGGSPFGVAAISLEVVSIVGEERLLYMDDEKLLGHLLRSHSFNLASDLTLGDMVAMHAEFHS